MAKAILGGSDNVPRVRQSAAEGVANVLRASILRGNIQPGTALREVSLAAELGVSRNTLREATRMLEGEGLVLQRPGRGIVVVELSDTDVTEIYHARETIEASAVPHLLALPDADDVWRHLDEIVNRLERAYTNSTLDEVLDLDQDFHRALVSTTGNQRLIRFHDGLQRELRLALALANSSARQLGRSRDDHRTLLKALRSRDEAAATAALRAHLAAGTDELTRLRATVQQRTSA
ncbi:GntR family transcriptional regulator [Amycolatopsis taiwanensis]|uniref:GntR family transcriptional regulator n=1 Tax=Amycolatopsis taiwanensis TaxID=342230 RepID=UPI0004AE7FC0|nr:GntR family transcriptional regulator [Amycolatopsis taiwanensis]